MTNKELGIAIRKDLKAAGFAAKDISVRVSYVTYDTSVRVTVKNPLVRLSEVEKIVKKYDEIDWDERTGEILAGGNTYVHCQYEYGIFDKIAEAYTPEAETILNSDFGDGKVLTVEKNKDKEINIHKVDNCTWNLSERLKNESISYNRYYIRSIGDLSVALWRFQNLGTIYA